MSVSPRMCWLAPALLCAIGASACGQEFQGLGFLPGGTSFSAAWGVSAAGDVVVGQSQPARAFRWTQASGMTNLGVLPGSVSSLARSCSADGGVVVGECLEPGVGTRAFRWTPGGMVDLGSLGVGPENAAYSSTLTGDVVVGHSSGSQGFRAFRWISGQGMVEVGVLPGHASSFASSISASGGVIIGRSSGGAQLLAFRWSSSTGMQELTPLTGTSTAWAHGVSPDGLCVVGQCGSGDYRAVRWVSATVAQDLGLLTGGTRAVAYASSHSGLVIVGDCTTAKGLVPFVWTEQVGMRSLSDILGEALPSGWVPTSARAVSWDGRVVVGSARNPSGGTEAFRAVLPSSVVPCYPNCDGSAANPQLNINDFVCFLNRFSTSHPYANCDGSTLEPVLNVNDFACFLQRFAVGCP